MPVFRFISEKLNLLIQKLPFAKGSFFQHVFILSGASVLAQLINIASMPILSRLYSPEDFGVLALFSSTVGILATISGFRYYLVLPLARRERYVNSIVWLSVVLQILCVLLITLLIIVFGGYVQNTSYSVLFPYRYLIPVGMLFIGMYSLAVQWAVREKEFALIAKTKLSQVSAACVVNVIGAILALRPLGLLLGNVIGQSCGLSVLLRRMCKKTAKTRFDLIGMKRVAVCYRKMCFFGTPSALLNMAGAYLLPLLIAYYFSPSIVGSFSMAQHALILPSTVVGTAIGQVFTQRAAEARYAGTLHSLTAHTFELLARVGIFPILLVSFLAPELFKMILGAEWREAGYFATLLGPWVALNFVYSPLSTLYTTLMLQSTGLMFVSVYTLTRLGSIIYGASSPSLSIFLLSFSGVCMMVLGISLLLSRARVNNLWRRWLVILFETLFEIAPMIFIHFSSCRSSVYRCIAISTSIAIYVVFLVVSYKKYKRGTL